MSHFTFIKMVKDCHQSVTLLWQNAPCVRNKGALRWFRYLSKLNALVC